MTRRARVGVAAIIVVALIVVAVVVIALWPREGDSTAPRAGSGVASELTDDQLSALARRPFDALVETCAQPSTEVSKGCGIRLPWAADFAEVDGIRYRVEAPPTLTVTPPTFRADDGILVATVTGTGIDGATKSLTYRTENWMLRGDVTVKNAGVVLSAW
ncbi:hypothetical protein [Microbacterium sp. Bi121]|uniref:hypothetical protein n=1 Tax=Microbacterium sp. Bi121 TaxID=2822348 RepID=UPI001D517C1E|nr:hypothetical protein [Microbacterium sp. Bi121]CAH0128413.1 hypothetical protein SRABI121_00696 [Microbacterium sp. Bi121]